MAGFAAAQRIVQSAIDAFGQLDILVNVAGIVRLGAVDITKVTVRYLASEPAADITGEVIGMGHRVSVFSHQHEVKLPNSDPSRSRNWLN